MIGDMFVKTGFVCVLSASHFAGSDPSNYPPTSTGDCTTHSVFLPSTPILPPASPRVFPLSNFELRFAA